MRVCHITTVHQSRDVRIFYKECKSLAKAGFEVKLLVINGETFSEDGVEVIGVQSKFSGRLQRFIKAPKAAYLKALQIDADIYHFHDPEFLPYAKKLKRKGKVVIYDVHEDLPRQILSKPYIPRFIRSSIALIVELYENSISKNLSQIITATPGIESRFKKINLRSLAINNYPILNDSNELDYNSPKGNSVCYVGAVSRIRGAKEMVLAMQNLRARLMVAGEYGEQDLESELKKTQGWENVDYFGFVDRQKARQIMLSSLAGLVVFYPEPNHVNAQPNKMFEYMAAGIPVIASNFKLWKEIVEKNNCGICVDPLDPDQIAQAINYIINNPQKAEKMGRKGLEIVREKYNWEVEKKKLVSIYTELI